MIIEFFGCTNAGKTTLANRTISICNKEGINLILGDQFILNKYSLHWIKNSNIRKIFLDLVSWCGFVLWGAKYRKFLYYCIKELIESECKWIDKVNITRNIVKRVGIFSILKKYNPSNNSFLLDGGCIQIAHHLFVHVSRSPQAEPLFIFAKLVPLPDIAFFITESEEQLFLRTLRSGHNRVKDLSQVKIFIQRTVDVFEIVLSHLIRTRRFKLDSKHPYLFLSGENQTNAQTEIIQNIITGQIEMKETIDTLEFSLP